MFMLVSATIVFAVQAQEVKPENVPAAVKAEFSKLYPSVKTVKWEKENGAYEAGFEMDKVEYSVLLDAAGKVMETENEIPVSKLPAAAQAYLSKNYPGQKVKEAAQIIDAKGVITFEAELETGDVIFTAEGQFIKTVKQ